MDHTYFEGEFKKLKTRWRNYYTDDMEEEAFIIVKNCPNDAFHGFVKKALWTKDAPNLEAFFDFARKHRPHLAEILSNCIDCDGRGNISAADLDGYDFWFACNRCEAGQKKHRDLPRWNNSKVSHYKLNRRTQTDLKLVKP
jgi:hypothetical protein